jgi:hypothetical protein
VKLFKITARHTQVNAPIGRVLTCWLGAENEEAALTMCEEKGIIDIESIIDDTDTHPLVFEKKEQNGKKT